MPKKIRFFVKTAMVYFVGSLVVGFLMPLRSFVDLPGFLRYLRPVYFHLFMVGWVTQLIMGVSIWMFPSYSKDQRFGPEELIWTIYVALNAGLIIRFFAEPLIHINPRAMLPGLALFVSSLLQFLAALCYIYIIWPRVKTK